MVFIKILKNAIQIKNAKVLIVFDNMIADMLSNKTPNLILTELLLETENFSCFYYTILFFCTKILCIISL